MMYADLLTRPDVKLFLPPIGGLTIYIWGDPATIPDEDVPLTVRVHDECNGSDVFGSDICTCRPYLAHAIEECIKTAQTGGCGVVRVRDNALAAVRPRSCLSVPVCRWCTTARRGGHWAR